MRTEPPPDWTEISKRLLEGDPIAVLKLRRLIAGFLAQLGAHDFHEEWPDLIQDVLLALLAALRKGAVREPEAMVGYIRRITRNKFVNRLKESVDRREVDGVDRPLTSQGRFVHPHQTPPQETLAMLHELLGRLPKSHRTVIAEVYGEGRTYEEVAREMRIPLGSLKRHLRRDLVVLRRGLST